MAGLLARLLGRGRAGPIEGTLADALLQRDVLGGIRFADRTAGGGASTDWRVLGAEVLTRDLRLGEEWSERWIVGSPTGARRAHTITFKPTSDGGTDWEIGPIELVVPPGTA